MDKKVVESDREILFHAAIDAINVFCRDVLIPKGYLDSDDWDDCGLLEKKYSVANRIAGQWKTCEIKE